MAIPNFQQQSNQALQSGLQIGSALRNSELLRDEQEFQAQQRPLQLRQMQQQNEFREEQQPLQLRQMAAQSEALEQDNMRKDLFQSSMLLASLDEKDGKQIMPELINKYQGNEPVLAALRDLYQSTGVDYIAKTHQAVSIFSGKPMGEKGKAPSKVLELEAAGYERGTPEFEEAMKSLIFKDTQGLTALKPSDVKGINKDVTSFVEPWKEVYKAAKDLDRLGKVKSAPAQMAMVFKYMKALDPESVVRESEYASARNTTGVPDQILNFYNKLVDGSLLNEKQVGEFIDVAKEMANSRAEGVRTSVSKYLAPYGEMLDEKRRDAFMDRADIKLFDIAKPIKDDTVETPDAPEVGSVVDGFTYNGGNPALRASWSKI